MLQFKFDGRQQYQLDAIEAVCDLFRGQPSASAFAGADVGDELGVANRLHLSRQGLLHNLQSVQARNGLAPVASLDSLNFSVEMETGTGKTYVYLRTAYELHARYGFKKFVIAVPSVAIREGVVTAIRQTREHFADLYAKVPNESWKYDSAYPSRLRQFAASNQVQFLVINIDAFNKPSNVIYKQRDDLNGRAPIEFIQACAPIVIIDEPQHFESELAQWALASLASVCTLRYSATHRNPYNLLYRLDPVRAYDLKLVKRIEVESVVDQPNFNRPYIRVESFSATRTKVTAVISLDVAGSGGVVRRRVRIKANGDDLRELSGGREAYQGYIVECMDAANRCVSFTNGEVISEGEAHGANYDDVMRAQVRETVREHFEKQLAIARNPPNGRRVKVLSLFFIDRVANYVMPDGKIRKWFVEAYNDRSGQPQYESLAPAPVEAVHSGYFAKQSDVPVDSSGASEADEAVYALIMSHKERLLSLDEPLQFIFSHSALREGWDNPNVFQLCTLNETKSEMKKRQEIGRGLRLAVDERGYRCDDPGINRLTVIANEQYEEFARALQSEIETDFGVSFEGRISKRRDRRRAQLRKEWSADSDFLALWSRIKHKTRYSVGFTTEDLVARASKAIAEMPPIVPPKIVARKAAIEIGKTGVETALLASRDILMPVDAGVFPDVIGFIQSETELTRATIAAILIKSGRVEDLAVDVQTFLDRALHEIQQVMQELMVAGIKYERIDGAEFEMMLFEQREIESYLSRVEPVKHSIYDLVECDSDIEREFAHELDAREDVKLFLKLPRWFVVETPLGRYNPDWAIVKECDGRVYLVRETKGSEDRRERRGVENAKIDCGRAHFDSLGVDFRAVTSAADV